MNYDNNNFDKNVLMILCEGIIKITNCVSDSSEITLVLQIITIISLFVISIFTNENN
ncbi:hypothetical protein P5E90_12735 [Clostridium perfringens]|nr:hypothetical protein [Clostridium perfringens]